MNREELSKWLDSGGGAQLVRDTQEAHPDIVVKKVITLFKIVPDSPNLHSWHYLQENPSYAREQKIIQSKPFKLSLVSGPELLKPADPKSGSGEAGQMTEEIAEQLFQLILEADLIDIYFADLDEVDVFLQQFDKGLDDLDKSPDTDSAFF
jgi:hypothetical protein